LQRPFEPHRVVFAKSGVRERLEQGKGFAMESAIDRRYLRVDEVESVSGDVLGRVHNRLSQSCHFSRHWREISCSFHDGVLILRGCVPSFYLKQVLQSMLMDIQGVQRIDNRVDVVCSSGLSSVRYR
jgi:osmotically-inducible protein OsmY